MNDKIDMSNTINVAPWKLKIYLASRFVFGCLLGIIFYCFFTITDFSYFRSILNILPTRESIFHAITLFKIANHIYFQAPLFLKLAFFTGAMFVVAFTLLKRSVPILYFFISFLIFTLLTIYSSFLTHEFFIISFAIIAIALYSIFRLNSLDDNVLRNMLSRSGVFTILVLTPLLSEIIFPSILIQLLKCNSINPRKRSEKSIWNHIGLISALVIGCNIIIAGSIPLITGNEISHRLNNQKVTKLSNECFYSLEIDKTTQRLLACRIWPTDRAAQRVLARRISAAHKAATTSAQRLSANRIGEEKLLLYDLKNIKSAPTEKDIYSEELQDIRIDEKKRVLYHFNRGDGLLYVYNLDTFEVINKSDVLAGNGSARVEFNEKTKTIAITREDDDIWILDDQSLEPIIHHSITGHDNEYIKSDPENDRYYLTHYKRHPTITILNSDTGLIEKADAFKYQGAVEISINRNEIFVALPLKSEILVIDRTTFRKKASIPTVFGVRHISLDETNDILIAGSMCTGFIDIISLEPVIRHKHIFVDYYIREIAMNPATRDALISSYYGLYHVKY